MNIEKVKISIITVTYNSGDCILDTFSSIKDQTIERNLIEYIVWDGGSELASIDAIKENSDIIDVLHVENDNGIYDAMNKAVSLAAGEWVIFLNAGDTFYNDTVLRDVIYYLENNNKGNSDILFGGYNRIFLGYNEVVIPKVPFLVTKNLFTLDVCHQATFVKTSVFRSLNGFDTQFKYCADHEFLIRICENKDGLISNIPFVVCNYDTNGISSIRRLEVLKERSSILTKHNFWSPRNKVKYVFFYQKTVLFLIFRRLKMIKYYRGIKRFLTR